MNFKTIIITFLICSISCHAANISITSYHYNYKKNKSELKKVLKKLTHTFKVDSEVLQVVQDVIKTSNVPMELFTIKINNKMIGYILIAFSLIKEHGAMGRLYRIPENYQEEVMQKFIAYMKKNNVACRLEWPDFEEISEYVFEKCGFQKQKGICISTYVLNLK